jgi:type I restriction enzyme, S subunit
MTDWPSLRLEDCCEIVSGATPSTSEAAYWDGDICWATPKDLSELRGAYISDTPRKLTQAGLESCAAAVLPPGSVLFSSRAPIGHVALNTVPMATNQGFKSFVPDPRRVHAEFLYYWLRKNRPYLEALGNGATFKEVSKAVVSRIEITLPPLPEQRRIAEVLGRVESLRAKRRAAIAQLDTLTQSIFLDMFGDPAANPKGWPRCTLKELGKVITGGTPPSLKPGMFDGPIPFVTPGDLESEAPVKRSVSEAGAEESVTVRPGSTLVCCIGATIGKIGKVAVRSAFKQQINAVEWGDTVHDSYGFTVLRFFKPTIIAWGASTTLPILKKSAFERIEIPVPPIDLQREFAQRLSKVERLEDSSKVSFASLGDLFGALQFRAFRGEL